MLSCDVVFFKPQVSKKKLCSNFWTYFSYSLHLILAFTRLLLQLAPLDDVGLDSLQGLDDAGLQLWYEFFFPITTLAARSMFCSSHTTHFSATYDVELFWGVANTHPLCTDKPDFYGLVMKGSVVQIYSWPLSSGYPQCLYQILQHIATILDYWYVQISQNFPRNV